MARAIRDAGFDLFPRQLNFLENFGGLVVENFHCAEIHPFGLTIIERMGGPSAEHILNSPEYTTGLSFDVLELLGSWRLDAEEDSRSNDLITRLSPIGYYWFTYKWIGYPATESGRLFISSTGVVHAVEEDEWVVGDSPEEAIGRILHSDLYKRGISPSPLASYPTMSRRNTESAIVLGANYSGQSMADILSVSHFAAAAACHQVSATGSPTLYGIGLRHLRQANKTSSQVKQDEKRT